MSRRLTVVSQWCRLVICFDSLHCVWCPLCTASLRYTLAGVAGNYHTFLLFSEGCTGGINLSIWYYPLDLISPSQWCKNLDVSELYKITVLPTVVRVHHKLTRPQTFGEFSIALENLWSSVSVPTQAIMLECTTTQSVPHVSPSLRYWQ